MGPVGSTPLTTLGFGTVLVHKREQPTQPSSSSTVPFKPIPAARYETSPHFHIRAYQRSCWVFARAGPPIQRLWYIFSGKKE